MIFSMCKGIMIGNIVAGRVEEIDLSDNSEDSK